MKSLKKTTSLIAASLLLCASVTLVASPQSAFAETSPRAAEGSFAFPFSYSAAELQSADKADALLSRLEHRIKRHCAPVGKSSVAERKTTDACVAQAMQQVVAKIGSSTLVTVYEDRSDG